MRHMQVYCNRWFAKFAAKEGISAEALVDAVRRAGDGLIDADLGNGLIKQRIARPGSGKSGGYRSILIFQAGERGIFVFGFAKNDRANLTSAELRIYRRAASIMLALDCDQIEEEVRQGRLVKVMADEQD